MRLWPFGRAKDGQTRRVRKLGNRIQEARNLRSLVRDPDLQAVEMERQGRRTLVCLWFFLALGLVYTTTGVQEFLAKGTTRADPMWWAAWCVEPMFAGLLITLLNFEAVILAHGVKPDHEWWARLKNVLLGSTLGMNVIPQLEPLVHGWESFSLGSLAVHAIIPVIVFGIAEVIPVIQARQRQVILLGYEAADQAERDSANEHEENQEEVDQEEVEPEDQDAGPDHEDQPEPAEPEQNEDQAEEPEPRHVSQPPAAPQPASSAPLRKAPKLPAPMIDQLKRAYERAAADGRRFTVADVHQVVRLPEAMARQVVDEFTTHNGHAFA